jgi:hypothetical protein
MWKTVRSKVLLALLAVAGSCTTPSVPIPPPEPEKIYFAVAADDGQARFSYDPSPSYGGAVVYVFNRDVGQGIITTAEDDGRVLETEPFPAVDGDEIIVTFEVETQISSTCVVLRDGQSSSSAECGL